jgi:hypothetical protein
MCYFAGSAHAAMGTRDDTVSHGIDSIPKSCGPLYFSFLTSPPNATASTEAQQQPICIPQLTGQLPQREG